MSVELIYSSFYMSNKEETCCLNQDSAHIMFLSQVSVSSACIQMLYASSA